MPLNRDRFGELLPCSPVVGWQRNAIWMHCRLKMQLREARDINSEDHLLPYYPLEKRHFGKTCSPISMFAPAVPTQGHPMYSSGNHTLCDDEQPDQAHRAQKGTTRNTHASAALAARSSA